MPVMRMVVVSICGIPDVTDTAIVAGSAGKAVVVMVCVGVGCCGPIHEAGDGCGCCGHNHSSISCRHGIAAADDVGAGGVVVELVVELLVVVMEMERAYRGDFNIVTGRHGIGCRHGDCHGIAVGGGADDRRGESANQLTAHVGGRSDSNGCRNAGMARSHPDRRVKTWGR